MSITYQAKNSDDIIDIELDDKMWCIGNELFSPSFVRRCLEYQETDFKFSINYELKIMDANINIITLNNNKYIEVDENEIIVKMIDQRNLGFWEPTRPLRQASSDF